MRGCGTFEVNSLLRLQLGQIIRKKRQAAGKTMGNLARHLGVSVVFVSDVERGKAMYSREQLKKVEELIGEVA